MKLLVDTHIFLWVLEDSPALTQHARDLLDHADAAYVSAASVWEICIKMALGKLSGSPAAMVQGISASGFVELPVLAAHAIGVAELPPIHQDPFDRLLVAQARAASLTLLTADTELNRYSEVASILRP